jgi:pyruvate/2-oxoglutarate dehydrogenase complex dihydrolipoamide dehydrogenase (E3) component/uncharacterized membrane protein YdjX (TVP38/TMEM64 family)
LSSRTRKILLLAVVFAAVAAAVHFDLASRLSFASLKEGQAGLEASRAASPALFLAGYFLLYVAVTALSLPGATVLTLAGGALFGLAAGSVVVSFASTLGATLAMLVSRFFLRRPVQARFGERLRRVDAGLERDGAFYLLALRLVPAVPFFALNLVMGLTSIRTRTYWWVSQLGMLPATLVFVNAGGQLAVLETPADILSPRVLLSLAALGLLPLGLKAVLGPLKDRMALRGHAKPKSFDRDLVVIGAGAGGLVTSFVASAAKARVTLIEKGAMGGDCLNTGCVPSKALLRAGKLLAQARRADELGLKPAELGFDFGEVMDRVHRVVAAIEPHDSVERYESLGVEVIEGAARILDPYRVQVGERVLTTRHVVVATGAEPLVPPLEGLDQVEALTSDTLWGLRELPERLVVVGGGPIGCEMAQAFARFGSKVVQLEMIDRILAGEDLEASELVSEALTRDGVRILAGHRLRRFGRDGRGQHLIATRLEDEEEIRVDFDAVLLALGRKARVSGFGLEELGVELDDRGRVKTDARLRTNVPTLWACGDVAGPYQLTHAAGHQGWHAAVNALAQPFWGFDVDYANLPWCTYTDPEVARVGLSEAEAKREGVPHEITTYDLGDLDRAIADGNARGFVRVLTPPGKDDILGVTIAGPHAGDLIQEFVLAKRLGKGLGAILATIHAYPTLGEAARLAAGQWRKDHVPRRLLRWAERLHAWRRG